MNRRTFMKSIAVSTGLLILKPFDILSTLPISNKVIKPNKVECWRDKILRLYPSGTPPLLEILKSGELNRIDDPEFTWWRKDI